MKRDIFGILLGLALTVLVFFFAMSLLGCSDILGRDPGAPTAPAPRDIGVEDMEPMRMSV